MNKILSALLLCLMVCFAANAKVYTWKGGAGDDGKKWDVAANWTVNGASDGTFPDGSDDDVIIPANVQTDGSWAIQQYPELTAAATCGNIYFDVCLMGPATLESARIQGQHYLTYTKAFCDISVTANRYIRVTSPLQSTYTGDFFVEHQTLDKSAWNTSTPGYPFVDALYEAVEGQAYVAPTYDENGVMTDPGVVNRAIRGTYYSFYSSDRDSLLPINSQVVHTVANQWGAPVNGLGTEILPATSFDVWVNNGATRTNSVIPVNGEVTFHFPVANSIYYYFDENGHWAKRRDPSRVDRSKAGRFAYGDENKEKLAVTLTHTGNSMMYAVGNPAFAYMDVAEFINANQKSIAPYVYKYVQGNPGTRGKERIYYYDYDQTPHKLYLINTNYDNSTSSSTETLENHQKANITGKTEITKNHREAYFNAAEGFRVIGGSVAFVCDEPDLVGVYNDATFTLAKELRQKYYSTVPATGDASGRISSMTSADLQDLKTGTVTFRYSISTTEKSDEVMLNNFLNRGSVRAKIVQSVPGQSGQLVIRDDQAIMAVFRNEAMTASNSKFYANPYADYWLYDSNSTYDGDENVSVATFTTKSYGNTTGTQSATTNRNNKTVQYRTLKLHGLEASTPWSFKGSGATETTDGSAYTVSYQVYRSSGHSSTSVTNPTIKAYNITNSDTKEIRLDYTITGNTVTIKLADNQKMFIEGDGSKNNAGKPAFNAILLKGGDSTDPTFSVKDYQCEAWMAYEGFTSSRTKVTGDGEFIKPEIVGEFSTYVRQNLGNTALRIYHGNFNGSEYTSTTAGKHKITVNRVLGSYNTVGIQGLYPGDEEAMVLGEVSYNNSKNRWELMIPAGQLAHIAKANGEIDPAHSHYFYSHGNAQDMVKAVVLVWTAATNSAKAYWKMSIKADNNECYETMVCRQGIQPVVNREWFDGLIYGKLESSNYFYLNQTSVGDINKAPAAEIKPGQLGILKLDYIPSLFVANPTLTTTNLVQAPRREAAVNNAPAFMMAVAGDMAANTMIIRRAEASNEFCRLEDAPLFDVDNSALAFGTLAGTQLVGVNAIASLDTLPLYLSTSATLSFANMASLGENVKIYDAVADTYTLIDEEAEYVLEVNDGEQAGRYFLVADAPAVNTSVEDISTEGYSWKPVAYCPAEGSLAVSCAEELSYEVYGINGMLIGAAKAQAYTFNGLHEGVYMVRATRGAEMQTLKVIVY